MNLKNSEFLHVDIVICSKNGTLAFEATSPHAQVLRKDFVLDHIYKTDTRFRSQET